MKMKKKNWSILQHQERVRKEREKREEAEGQELSKEKERVLRKLNWLRDRYVVVIVCCCCLFTHLFIYNNVLNQWLFVFRFLFPDMRRIKHRKQSHGYQHKRCLVSYIHPQLQLRNFDAKLNYMVYRIFSLLHLMIKGSDNQSSGKKKRTLKSHITLKLTSSSSSRWHGQPAFSADFVAYFLDRQRRFTELEKSLEKNIDENTALRKQQSLLNQLYDKVWRYTLLYKK